MQSTAKHILVIRFSSLGDVAMTVPVVAAFSEAHPKIKISVLTKQQFAPLFAHITTVEVVGVDLKKEFKGFFGLFRLAKKIKTLKVDAVADLHNVLRTKVLSFFLPKHQWSILDKARTEKRLLISGQKFEPLRPMIERYADVFRGLGFDFSLENFQSPKPQPLSKEMEILLKDKNKPYIGIAPFAAYASKTYPLEKMKYVIAHLSKVECTVILFGGGKEEIEKLTHITTSYPNVISVAGQFSLQDELILMQQLSLMLAMDSGNAHMAALMGVKVLTLWGVTHPFSGFKPYNQPLEYCLVANREKFPKIPTSVYGNRYPKGYEKAIETISEESVIAAIQKLL